MKKLLSLGTAAIGLLNAGGAFAHASFANEPVKPESYFVAVLQLPHGCKGKPTNEVRVTLPEGFVFAKPQPKAGWELEIIKGDYQKSYDDQGQKVTSGPIEIRWKGGDLPDEFYDTFAIRGKVSGIEAGGSLAFKTIQLCGTDGKVLWDEVAAPGVNPHSLKNPAPVIKVAGGDDAMPGMAGHDMQGQGAMSGSDAGAAPAKTMEAAKVGDIELSAGFTKAMLPGQPVGGGFVTIKNGGASDDRLVSVESPVAGRVELHEMAMVNDVMKMRQLNEGIPVPAGQTVELKPGALHMMFFQVKQPFVEGGSVPVKLTFEKAGTVEIVLPVGPAKGK
ncbi:MAG: hypothetical protein DI528_11125 [Shinella sp.]|nr:MAG: hypothetical protein DI528_11125 [Shinella sp.]